MADKFITSRDTSLLTLATDEFKRTGRRTSPYLCRPERETYTQTEVYERPDGTRYERTRSVYRWNGLISADEWSEPKDLQLPVAQ